MNGLFGRLNRVTFWSNRTSLVARILSFCLSVSFSIGAHAICPDGIHKDVFSDLSLIQQVSIIGEEDNRETYEEYGLSPKRKTTVKEVYNRFSATGTFYCAGYEGSANVVLRNNLIVLAAHQFYKKDSCAKALGGDFSSCYFETIGPHGSRGKPYKIKSATLKLGPCTGPKNQSNDWAIVELEENVTGVTPYSVVDVRQLATAKDDYDALIGLKTTTVVARNDNFKSHPIRTPSICDNSIGGVQLGKPNPGIGSYFLASGCSSGHGNSGGAVLLQQQSGTPALIGVVSGGMDNMKDHLPFGPNNYTGAALIEGRFYDTLMGM